MNGNWLFAVATTAMLAASYPCVAQSDAGVPSSGGAPSSGAASSGGATSGGATSESAPAPEIAPGGALSPGAAAGTNEAGSLSTEVLLGVGAVGLIVGVVLVTFNHGNQTISTSGTN